MKFRVVTDLCCFMKIISVLFTRAGPATAETSPTPSLPHITSTRSPPPLIVLPTIPVVHNFDLSPYFGCSVFVPEPQFVLWANVAEGSRFKVQGSRFKVHGSRLTVQGSLKCSLQSLIYRHYEIEQIIYTQTCVHELL